MPVLAVPGIEAIDVSGAEARACRNMVETALIKTRQYRVLSYRDIQAILEAQEYSLSDCTDETCAVEVGRLLSARYIVVGELSGFQDFYVLNLRLIDVETGISISAELIEFESMENLKESAFKISYALVDQDYKTAEIDTQKEFGQLYIEAPKGMDLMVFINEEMQGKTPLYIDRILFGTYTLTATGENYIFETKVTIDSNQIKTIIADIELQTGNIVLETLPPDAQGFDIKIDGTSEFMGKPIKPGLIQGFSAGQKRITVESESWRYQGVIDVVPNQTVKHTLLLEEIGIIELGSALPFIGNEYIDLQRNDGDEIEISPSSSMIKVKTGRYTITVTHPDYEPIIHIFEIGQGERVIIDPVLDYTGEFLKNKRLAELKVERDLILEKRRRRGAVSVSFFITGGLAGAAVGILEWKISDEKVLLQNDYDLYSSSTNPDNLEGLWNNVESHMDNLSSFRLYRNISLGTAALFEIFSAVLFALRPSVKSIDREIELLEAQ